MPKEMTDCETLPIWKPDRPKICVSFSGGRSSAYMTYKVIELYGKSHELLITFANTGLEHAATLDFVRECETRWGLDIHWLEYDKKIDTSKGRWQWKNITKRVTYETASRNGEPFEKVIERYGIPNMVNQSCTRELKTNTMNRYRKAMGFTHGKHRNSCVAIGIRADEINRVSDRASIQGLFYPLVDLDVTKEDVNRFWHHQPFDLQLPSDAYGNCVTCWKKTDRKLITIAIEQPKQFRFFERMERENGKTNATNWKGDLRAAANPADGRRYFFREHRRVDDFRAKAVEVLINQENYNSFQKFSDDEYGYDFEVESKCSESCEVY